MPPWIAPLRIALSLSIAAATSAAAQHADLVLLNGAVTTDAEAVLAAGSALLEAMKREPDLGTASIRDSTSQPLAIAQTYARLVHEIEGPEVLVLSAQTLAGADDELRRLRSSLDQADGKNYSALEHAWDEAFGYFGAARFYDEMSDDDCAVTLPDARFRDTFPTIGHAVVHILGSHFALHMGQLSCWLRVMGYEVASEMDER